MEVYELLLLLFYRDTNARCENGTPTKVCKTYCIVYYVALSRRLSLMIGDYVFDFFVAFSVL